MPSAFRNEAIRSAMSPRIDPPDAPLTLLSALREERPASQRWERMTEHPPVSMRIARVTSSRKARAIDGESRSVLCHGAWDVLFIGLALVHGALLLLIPSIPLIGIGLWWNANTISHNFIHGPFFRSRGLNAAFSSSLSLVLGLPQRLWRDRHLAHHADKPWRWRWSKQLAIELALVTGLWVMLLVLAPLFLITVYFPGLLLGLGLCQIQGRFEHEHGTTSHYGWLYNLLFFNDGYHVEHHAHPGEYWRDLPKRIEPSTKASRWPAVLRWLNRGNRSQLDPPLSSISLSPRRRNRETGKPGKTPPLPGPLLHFMEEKELFPPILDGLERLVLRSKTLQRFVLKTHEQAFRALLPSLRGVRRVGIVGGGLFPRTALVLQRILPNARITVIEADADNLGTAKQLLNGSVHYVHEHFNGSPRHDFDLLVIPLAFDGNRAAIYRHPPAPAVLVHDWFWRPRGTSEVVSWCLLKRLNLVRR